jgi:hypothetical protein
MGWNVTLAGAGLALALLLLAARMQARRGIGRWSHVPWDYAMILAALLLLGALGHAAVLWRDGWPL